MLKIDELMKTKSNRSFWRYCRVWLILPQYCDVMWRSGIVLFYHLSQSWIIFGTSCMQSKDYCKKRIFLSQVMICQWFSWLMKSWGKIVGNSFHELTKKIIDFGKLYIFEFLTCSLMLKIDELMKTKSNRSFWRYCRVWLILPQYCDVMWRSGIVLFYHLSQSWIIFGTSCMHKLIFTCEYQPWMTKMIRLRADFELTTWLTLIRSMDK